MIRTLLYLLGAIIAVSILRTVIGLVTKLAAGWFGIDNTKVKGPTQSVPVSGVLRKDPVCGTYVSEAISLKTKTAAGVVHFCSEQCRSRYIQESSQAS